MKNPFRVVYGITGIILLVWVMFMGIFGREKKQKDLKRVCEYT